MTKQNTTIVGHSYILLAKEEEHTKWRKDMAKLGWKLEYVGPEPGWVGTPIYKVKQSSKKANKVATKARKGK